MISDINQSAKVLIVINSAGGLGDYAGGVNLANILNDKAKISCENIFIAASSKENVGIFNTKNFKVLSVEEAQAISHFDLRIFFPVIQYQAGQFMETPAPILMINEYGFGKDSGQGPRGTEHFWKSEGLGLNPEDLGIFIDENLGAPVDREEAFSMLDPILQSLLLKTDSSTKEIPAFFNQNRLYSCYCQSIEGLSGFIGALVKLNNCFKNPSKNIVIIAPGNKILETIKDQSFTQYLIDQGVQNFDIQRFEQDKPEQNKAQQIFSNDSKGSQLRVIYGSFNNATLKLIAKTSKKQTITTGDQSVSEAISCFHPNNPKRFKFFMYEELDHKNRFASSLFHNYQFNIKLLENLGRKFDEGTCDNIFNAIAEQKSEKYATFAKISEEIRGNLNCSDRLSSIVQNLIQVKKDSLPILLDPSATLTPKDLKFDQWYVISFDQFKQINIPQDTGKSEHQEIWKNSLFTSKFIGDAKYLLMRKDGDMN